MRNSKLGLARGAVLVALALLSALAKAEAPNPQAQAALARAQGLLRQLNEQKQALELDNSKLKASNAGLEQQLKRAKLETGDQQALADARAKEIEQTSAKLVRAKERTEKFSARIKEIVAKYKDQARTLRDVEAEKARLQDELSAARTELADAEQKNLALYQVNREIIDKYKQKSRWSALLQKEPFLGFKQVEIENQAQALEQNSAKQLRDGNMDAVAP
jgi:chromosome segregation ATPase